MKLSELIATIPLPRGAKDVNVTDITADSRDVRPGTLFVAIKGTARDGWDFIDSAIDKGAVAILAEKGRSDPRLPVITVDNVRQTLAYLAARLYAGQPDTVIAITGTNGKSSTVEFVRQIWAHAGLNAACFGTLGIATNDGIAPLSHTTPDAVALQKTLAELKAKGVTHCAMEASSHGLKQYRLDAVRLAATGFSNLTQDHFDYHPTMDDYRQSKARLFTDLAQKGTPAVINVDGEDGRYMADAARKKGLDVITVGWAGEHIRIDEVIPRSASQTVDLIWNGQRERVELPLAGEFQVLNAVSAAGFAMATGVEKAVILDALSRLKGVDGRMDRVGFSKTGAPIFVDFAHTPDGLEKVLRGVRPHTQGRIIAVFGCGGDRDPDKRAKMGAIAARLADHVIVTDDNPRTEDPVLIRKAVMKGCPEADEIGERRAAIAAGIDMLKDGDCLVIAGKGHESGQIIGKIVHPFKDSDVVQELLEARS